MALSPCTFTKCVDAALVPLRLQGIRIMNYIDDWLILVQSHQLAVRHQDIVLAHMKELGLGLNTKKSVLSPLQRTTFLGVVWDSTSMQARLLTYRVHPVGCKKYKARQVIHCQTVSEAVWSYGISIQRDRFWTAVHETSTVVAQDQRVFPEGQPLLHDQGSAAMLSCLGNVEETVVPVLGSPAGSFMLSQNANDRCLSHGLGSDPRGKLESRSVEGLASLMAHQPSEDVGCISCSGLLHKSPGVVCGHVHFTNWRAKSSCGPKGSCCLFEQLTSRGPTIWEQTSCQDGGSTMRWWSWYGGSSARHKWICLCPLWFSLTHPAPLGLDTMVQMWPRVRLYAFPPIALLPGVLERVHRDQVLLFLIAPRWLGRVWFPDLISLLDGPLLELPIRSDLLSQAGGLTFHLHPELWKQWAWILKGPIS